MANLPFVGHKHKICIICEGFEDHAYMSRLTNIGVWNNCYDFKLINAKSASNIPARYQDAFQNNYYELVLVFCDTDKYPYKEYSIVKQKIAGLFGKAKAAERTIIYANPCTMQIILSHFGDVALKNQGKKTNSDVIEKLTGVKDYDAHEDQISTICKMINRNNYMSMKARVALINFPDTTSCSTNFSTFIDRFENNEIKWIAEIQRCLKEE